MGDHDISRLYSAMREKAENKHVPDTELWREWREHGKANHIDVSSNCICGVSIKWEHEMKNILNGTVISPVGNVCIKNAMWQRYNCRVCKRNFATEVSRPAIQRRIKTGDWICNPCGVAMKKKHDRYETDDYLIWLYSLPKPTGILLERKRWFQNKGITVEDN